MIEVAMSLLMLVLVVAVVGSLAYGALSAAPFLPLKQKTVDTGMGVERTVAVLNGLQSDYETELFKPIMQKIKELSNSFNEKSARIVLLR